MWLDRLVAATDVRRRACQVPAPALGRSDALRSSSGDGGGDMAEDLDHVRSIVRRESLAVVATSRADGTVHTSVVNAGVVEDPVTGEARVGLVVRGDARKLPHLRRSGRAAVVFRHGPDWVAVEGPVSLIGPADPVEGFSPAQLARLIRSIFVAAGGTHQDWDEFDRVMAAEARTAVLVAPERISGNG
jgi:PPOX class probable F420-dependent enzyme